MRGGNMTGQARDHGHADTIIVVECAFGDQTVLAEIVAVIAGEDDQGVLSETEFIEVIYDLPDGFVHAADHPVVTSDVLRQFVAIMQM